MRVWLDAHHRIVTLVVLAVAIIVPIPGMLDAGAFAMEEGLVLVGGELVTRGLTPNGDFEHLYGPGNLWAVAAAFSVFGVSVTVERLVGLVYRVVLLAAIHRLCRRFGWGTALSATLLAWAIVAPFGLIAYSWIGGLAFATAALAVALDAGESPRRLTLAGLLGGAALLFRPDLIIAVGLSLGSIVVGLTWLRRRSLIAGLALGLSPYLIHVLTAGLRPAVEGMIVDPVFRLRSGRRLPVPPRFDDSGDFFARLGALGGDDLPGLDQPAQIAVLFWIVVAAVAVLVAVAVRRRDARLTAMTLLAVGVLPQLMQRPSPNHLKFVGVLALPFAAAAVGSALRRGRSLVPVAVFLALVLIAPHHIGRYTWDTFVERPVEAEPVSITFDGRSLPTGDPTFRAELAGLLDAFAERATPDDRVFVGPEDLTRTNYSYTALYHLLADYEPASYHLEMNPGLANREGGRLADDVASADWLILSDRFDGWTEPNSSTEAGDLAAATVLDADFCAQTSAGSFTLYGRC